MQLIFRKDLYTKKVIKKGSKFSNMEIKYAFKNPKFRIIEIIKVHLKLNKLQTNLKCCFKYFARILII